MDSCVQTWDAERHHAKACQELIQVNRSNSVESRNKQEAAMSAPPLLSQFGSNLTSDDYAQLTDRAIPQQLANDAGIRRVASHEAREMFGRRKGDLGGLLIPNLFPGEGSVREYRLRLDNPELEHRTDGTARERGKYIQPPERRNILYFPPPVPAGMLVDTSKPVLMTEGEFKALALWNVANHNALEPRFMPVSVPGVWSFRGTVGKTANARGERVDVKGIIPDIDRIVWKGRPVIIAFDADVEQNPKVRAARWHLTVALMERGATVGLLEWQMVDGKGIDDRIAKIGPDRVLEDISNVQFGDWKTRLLRGESGKLLPSYDNAAIMLENSPEWAGVLGFNEFSGAHSILKPPPSPVTGEVGSELQDHFDTECVRWLERRGVMVRPDLVRRVIDSIARRNGYHPVRDYLEGLPTWDGQRRIGSWLIDYAGVQSSDGNPNSYAMAVGEKFLISAVARVMDPGCKADHLLVLEGPQGIGKSSAVRILASDQFFSDQLAELGSKDASMQNRGVWIIELSELGALTRGELEKQKAFLSQQVERFRLPYGHRLVHIPRQCVFIGTTNSDTWLRDETGGRRFWPVRCRQIDIAGLKRDRDQLWAEALHAYRSGVTWWLDDEQLVKEAAEEQRGRFAEDVWQADVLKHAEAEADHQEGFTGGKLDPLGRGSVAIPDLLRRLGIETAKQDQSAANRVARCLKAGGWERFRKKTLGQLEWRYRMAETPGVPIGSP
jgi:predicted P-loop ATPase